MTNGRMALSRRSVLAGGMVLGAGAILPGCKPVMSGLLTGADAHPGDYPTVRAVEFMGRYLDEKTGGRLGIRMFAGGQLGSETDTLEITSFGGIDFNRVCGLVALKSHFLLNPIDRLRIDMCVKISSKRTGAVTRGTLKCTQRKIRPTALMIRIDAPTGPNPHTCKPRMKAPGKR